MLENLLEIVDLLRENWRLVLEVVSAAFTMGLMLRSKKWKRAAVAFSRVGHICYSAIEEAGSKIDSGAWEKEKETQVYRDPVHYVKRMVHATVKNTAQLDPAVLDAENAIRIQVDPKSTAPPIKRFWRRFINGKNLAGVAAKVFGRAAISKVFKEQFE